MTHQLALTVIVDLIPGREEEARGILREMNANPIGDLLPFAKVPSVHFARLFILDETKDLRGERLPAQLILMSDIDAPERLYWDDLRAVGEGLDGVLRCCDGYPQNASSESRISYLQAHRVTPAAMYVNTVGRTANQIHQEAGLRDAIQGYLDTHRGDHADLVPQEMRRRIRDFVDGEESLRWARSRPSSDLMWRLKEAVHLVAVPLLLLLLLPVLVIVVPVAAVLLRLKELRDGVSDERPTDEHSRRLGAIEDHVVQNQFTAVGFLKPGPLRRFTLQFILWLANYATRHVFNRGRLTGVKTIHFARWVFLNDKRRMVFTSNYDGSLEGYMDDFIDKVAWGLNGVFTNGVGYPKTRWLVFEGARDEMAFKNYLRVNQHPTEFWYSAYDDLTAQNIENNAFIRAGLSGSMTDGQAAEWLRRI
jgi:hypothetical protein